MDRCALFVDAGYMLADGATAVHGTSRGESVCWDYAGLLRFLASLSADRTGHQLLRCYWYEATVDGRRAPEHDTLADLPGLTLRLGRMRPGKREGAETEIRRDLSTLAGNRAICDVLLVSAGEDLAQVVADVQDLGVRVIIVHISVDGNWTVSRPLRQQCDDIVEIDGAQLRPYVELVAAAGPARYDEQYAVTGYGGKPQVNGHAAGAGGGSPGLPSGFTGSRLAPPATYTAPAVTEHQPPAQPAARQPPAPSSSGPVPAMGGGASEPDARGMHPGHAAGNSPPEAAGPPQAPPSQPSPSLAPQPQLPQLQPGPPAPPLYAPPAPGPFLEPAAPPAPGPPGPDLPAARQGAPASAPAAPGQFSGAPPALPGRYGGQPDGPPGDGPGGNGLPGDGLPAQRGPHSARSQPLPHRHQAPRPAAAPGADYVSQRGPYHAPLPEPSTAGGPPAAGSLADTVQAAHAEGFEFGESVAGDAPALWLEAVLARKPRMPSDLEARLLQGSALPVDALRHDEVRHALRRGFWDALDRSRR